MRRWIVLAAVIAIACPILLLCSTAHAGWFLSLRGSAIQTPDSVGTGYMVSLGVGYRFSAYLAATTEVGWASYAVESGGETLRVNQVPVTETLTVDLLPGQPVDPFVEGGVGGYGTKIEGESWDYSFGLHGGGGLRIRLGSVFGVNLHGRYTIPDVSETDEGAWSYGVDFGLSLGG